MKKLQFILIMMIPLLAFGQWDNPQAKWVTKIFFPDPDIEINTPAFQKKKGYTKYKDLVSFLQNVQSTYPQLAQLNYIGESQKGKKIPMLILNRESGNDSKIRVWIQGGLHGNEPGSTEGVLHLINEILGNDQYAHFLDRLEIAFVPMANIDGYEKQSRYAANGLDLNRDQTKILAPETVVLKNAFNRFNPHVALDFHEYRPYRRDFVHLSDWGVTSYHDVMFLFSGNLNVPENLRKFTDEVFVENARQKLKENGLRYRNYISTRDHYGDIHFTEGSSNARSSATNWALTNTISALIEVRGVAIGKRSFKRRILSTFLVGISFLQSSYDNPEAIVEQLKVADQWNGKAVVTSSSAVYPDTIQAIDLNARKAISLPVTIRNALKASPELIRERPNAYIIDGSEKQVLDKLKILGLSVQPLPQNCTLQVQSYTVSEYYRNPVKYEGVFRQEVVTQLKDIEKTFDSEFFMVSMEQSRANMAIELLEPEAPNSLVSFSVIRAKNGMELPIYRLTEEYSCELKAKN
jgi:hypothetical protein